MNTSENAEPRNESLRIRAYRMRVQHREIARRILAKGETGFSNERSLAVYLSKLFAGRETSKRMLDQVERVLDEFEATPA